MLYDHVDLRVSDLAKARVFYDPLMIAMGFTRFDTDGRNINYHLPDPDRTRPFFGLMEQNGHTGNASRVAFRAANREEVDRLAKVAHEAGAHAFEAPENYTPDTPWYYATFFEDLDGNKLEICYRE
jgi:predicted lactoylglutathione lyase